MKASDALEVLFGIRHRALAAAHMLITEDPTLYPDEETEARRAPAARVKQLEDDLLENRATGNRPMPTDRLSQELDLARSLLEAECRPLLREQTIIEFCGAGSGWQRPKASRVGRALRHRGGGVAPALRRSAHLRH